jgi:Glycosyl transferase family 2
MLGSMQQGRYASASWVLAGVDVASAGLALAALFVLVGGQAIPSLVVAPLVFGGAIAACGGYRRSADELGGARPRWVFRILAGGLFTWTAALLANASGPALGAGAQLSLWGLTVLLSAVGRSAVAPLVRRLRRPERWIVIGDEAMTEELLAYAPLKDYASVVCKVKASSENGSSDPDRAFALRLAERHRADRVVIASREYDDNGLVKLIGIFRAVGMPVSLLPRPLDLLEATAAKSKAPRRLGLIEVGVGPARDNVPYTGPDRRRDRRTRVSVVVPAKNEAENIAGVLERLPDDLHEVILVDGHSEDGTVEVAQAARPDIRVLTQRGRGKGDALRAGFAAVTGNLIVTLDADGSADPAEIPRFVDALVDGTDFAKGSRFLEGGGSADITRIRRLGNRALSTSANLLHGTRFTDLCYGYNAFWTRCLPFISLDAPGFEVETLINLRMAAAGMRIREVPSYESARVHGESNLYTFRDGWRVLRTIVRESPFMHRRRSETARSAPIPTGSAEATQHVAG